MDATTGSEGQSSAEERFKQIVGLLQLADAFASTLVKDGIYQEDLSELLNAGGEFGVDSSTLSEAFDGAKEEWQELGKVFSVGTAPEIPSLTEAHSRASREHRIVIDD